MDSYSHERRLIIKFVRKKHSKKWTSLVVDVFSVMFWWVGPIWRVFADFWFVFDFGTQKQKRPCVEWISPPTEAIFIADLSA